MIRIAIYYLFFFVLRLVYFDAREVLCYHYFKCARTFYYAGFDTLSSLIQITFELILVFLLIVLLLNKSSFFNKVALSALFIGWLLLIISVKMDIENHEINIYSLIGIGAFLLIIIEYLFNKRTLK
jgi:hypothetical protein